METKSPVWLDFYYVAIAEKITNFFVVNIANEDIIDECAVERLKVLAVD